MGVHGIFNHKVRRGSKEINDMVMPILQQTVYGIDYPTTNWLSIQMGSEQWAKVNFKRMQLIIIFLKWYVTKKGASI